MTRSLIQEVRKALDARVGRSKWKHIKSLHRRQARQAWLQEQAALPKTRNNNLPDDQPPVTVPVEGTAVRRRFVREYRKRIEADGAHTRHGIVADILRARWEADRGLALRRLGDAGKNVSWAMKNIGQAVEVTGLSVSSLRDALGDLEGNPA